jgi:hypothetical protein
MKLKQNKELFQFLRFICIKTALSVQKNSKISIYCPIFAKKTFAICNATGFNSSKITGGRYFQSIVKSTQNRPQRESLIKLDLSLIFCGAISVPF